MLCPLVDAVLDVSEGVAVRIHSWIQASLIRASGVRLLSAPGVGRSIQIPWDGAWLGMEKGAVCPNHLKFRILLFLVS